MYTHIWVDHEVHQIQSQNQAKQEVGQRKPGRNVPYKWFNYHESQPFKSACVCLSHISFFSLLINTLLFHQLHLCRHSFLKSYIGQCWEPAWGTLPLAKVMRKEAQHYAKTRSSLRKPPVPKHLPPKPECLLYCFILWPTPLTLRGADPHHLSRRRS